MLLNRVSNGHSTQASSAAHLLGEQETECFMQKLEGTSGVCFFVVNICCCFISFLSILLSDSLLFPRSFYDRICFSFTQLWLVIPGGWFLLSLFLLGTDFWVSILLCYFMIGHVRRCFGLKYWDSVVLLFRAIDTKHSLCTFPEDGDESSSWNYFEPLLEWDVFDGENVKGQVDIDLEVGAFDNNRNMLVVALAPNMQTLLKKSFKTRAFCDLLSRDYPNMNIIGENKKPPVIPDEDVYASSCMVNLVEQVFDKGNGTNIV